MQSSRSVSTTCPRKGSLLRFKLNSAATSDGGEQKLGNNVRGNSESITTKVCSPNRSQMKCYFESHVVTSVDRTRFKKSEKSVAGGAYTVLFQLLIWTNGLVDKTGCRESGNMGLIPDDYRNLLQRLGHFVWHWASQCTLTCTFYIDVLSIIFFLLGFCQWQSRADRVVNLNTTIRLPSSTVLENLNSGPGPQSPTCAGLAHGQRL